MIFERSRFRHAPMTAAETVEAAVLVDVALVMLVVAHLVLPVGPLFSIASMLAFTVLAFRRRMRVLLVAVAAAVALAAVVLGPHAPGGMLLNAASGAVVGVAVRRRWGAVRTVVQGGLTLWAPVTALSIGSLAAFDAARQLIFAQARAFTDGLARLPGHPQWPRRYVQAFLDHWPSMLAAALLIAYLGLVLVLWLIARPILRRLSTTAGVDPPAPVDEPAAEPPAPVPVRLDRVGFRYPGGDADALTDLSLDIAEGQFVGVVGANGSGKSTLGLLLAGRAPTSGRIDRAGPAGLGRPGGCAVIGQRPESQVLGVRVRDDVLWGVPDPDRVDLDGVLGEVGLAGFGDRETATLSGGQLQRVAVAAALARQPRLLISDESTSMLDESGRADVVAALARLRDLGITVVHITHREEDLEPADVVVHLRAGRRVSSGVGEEGHRT